MEKLDKKQGNKAAKSQKEPISNPIEKAKSPIKGTSMISVPKLPRKKTANPLGNGPDLDSIVETMNNFNSTKTGAKTYAAPSGGDIIQTKISSVNYSDIMRDVLDSFKNCRSILDLFGKLDTIFTEKLNWNFTGFGIFHEKSKCINLKLYSQSGNSYSSKIFMSDETNPIIECFKTQTIIDKKDIKYLNIPYLLKTRSVIVPMLSVNKCVGVMLIGQGNSTVNTILISFIANYIGMFLDNFQLIEKTNKYANTDNLTSLYNHRGFQEVLAKELERAKKINSPLSVVMFDVNNITKINRELGHAKGDEVIKIIAEKVKQNIKNTDSAGRYGGDEIAVIMPDTNIRDAKYMAEYITYTLSCCFVDDVGPVKVSVGIATYPESAQDQEKLLLLAEQAMFISQAKGYKEGMSAIVCSEDFDFWDDVAVNSFAEILAKRHFENGINFEEELIKKLNNNTDIINHNNLMEIVTSLASAIDAKDPYTKGHSTSVSRYAEALARAINMPEADVERIKIGAMLHDVGKIGIPENVLKKPGKLTDEEWQIMKQHPTIGVEKVLKPNKMLHEFVPIVKYHHERLDGKGYPDGLKGEEIPLEARIVAVADAYHALVSDRPYRKGMSLEKACAILQEGAGTQWDSNLVRHFISIAPSLTSSV